MIVDRWGNPTSSRTFNRSSANGHDRPWVPTRLDDIQKMVPAYQANTLVAVSRLLVENWGPARAIARQIPMYSVGQAWKPSLNTADETIKAEAESVIRDQFCRLTDIQGRDFTTFLYHLAHLLVRDGEAFYLLTERRGGFPAVQILPRHRVGQRDSGETHVQGGRFSGYRIEEGVITNRYGATVAYRVLGKTEDEDQDISTASLKHIFDSDYPEGRRGYPAMAHALNDGRDALQAHEWERLKMLAVSAHTLIEHTQTGAPDDDPRDHFESDGTTPLAQGNAGEMQTGTLFGGIYKTVKANSGYKLEAMEHKTPGETWESYQNRLIRKVCVGVPWPFSFVWEGNGAGGGVAERRDIMQARETIRDIQALLEPHARGVIGYAFKKLVKLGRISDSPDWWRWSFSTPPKLTVDDGRVSKAMLELWRAGVVSDEDILDDMGKDHDEHFQRKFTKACDKELMFEDIQNRKSIRIDSRYKGMFTPNDMGEETTNNQEDEDTN